MQAIKVILRGSKEELELMNRNPMMKTMLENVEKLCQATATLGNVNTCMVVGNGDVPAVRIAGFHADFEIVADSHGKYDVWTTKGKLRPLKVDLSLDQAADMLVHSYTTAKRAVLRNREVRRYQGRGIPRKVLHQTIDETLDEYFDSHHNGHRGRTA